uniref:Uncharacterized protein n=1 Tax=Coccolithus braarudii TaxID=221442 RepID=A0A7S0L0X4_9EUKA
MLDNAQAELEIARTAYGEGLATKMELIRLVQGRIDVALSKKRRAQAYEDAALQAPAGPTPQEVEAATFEGDGAVSRAVGAIGRKDFPLAIQELDRARKAFGLAGQDLERARASTLENVYAAMRAELERSSKVERLLRTKKILQRAKEKEKARQLGLDPDLLGPLEEALDPPPPGSAA